METKVGKLELTTCIMNASGVHCISETDLEDLNNSISGAIITKSTTFEKRDGNPLPRYYDNEYLSINSSGLPNLGYKFYIDQSKILVKSKPYIISVSGLSHNDNINIVKAINDALYVDGIELNLSCPNIVGKPQIGYDFNAMDNLLKDISNIISPRLNFGIKLPPYFDMSHFQMVANIINRYNIDSITCINSLGNGIVVENESVTIAPKNGHGGIGGSVVKPIALSNVVQFSKLTKCSIIGCGGISNGMDAFEHILCGASAIQIGTQLYKEGLPCFKRIMDELKDIMDSKGYNSIDDFRGKLKSL